jgi:hypothetical protein
MTMQGTLYDPRNIRFEDRDEPKIIKPTDAVIRISSAFWSGMERSKRSIRNGDMAER